MMNSRSILPAFFLLLASVAVANAQTRPTTGTGSAVRRAGSDPTLPDLIFVDAGGGYHFNTYDVSETRTDPYYAETKTWTANYSLKNAPTFAIGGGVRVWRHLLAGATFTRFEDSQAAGITGQVPNPFVFNKPRDFSGTSQPLTHQEQTVHVSALWRTRVSPNVEVGAFGGPSFISLKRDFVSDVQFTEEYPYDTATFSGAVAQQVSKSSVGFHVGADLAWYFTRNIGVTGTVRYAHANAAITTPAGNPLSLKLGGAETTAGVRISFGGRPAAPARPAARKP
jgi:opacity protein-like surface antigen